MYIHKTHTVCRISLLNNVCFHTGNISHVSLDETPGKLSGIYQSEMALTSTCRYRKFSTVDVELYSSAYRSPGSLAERANFE